MTKEHIIVLIIFAFMIALAFGFASYQRAHKEVDSGTYEVLARLSSSDDEVKCQTQKALEDGKITFNEYKEIFEDYKERKEKRKKEEFKSDITE
jgi:hypothetical protein